LTILVSGLIVAVSLGALFSLVYPRVEIDLRLASLFALGGLAVALGVRGAWRTIRRTKA
jgi:hypothetical protein